MFSRSLKRYIPFWQAIGVLHHTHIEEFRPQVPQAQAVLRPYLLGHAEDYCSSPLDSENRSLRLCYHQRVTPLSCGNRPGGKTTAKRKRPACASYSTGGYRRALVRAADNARVERWSPNQLRYSAATLIRSQFGLEAAQVVLGHIKATSSPRIPNQSR
jgi:integrase